MRTSKKSALDRTNIRYRLRLRDSDIYLRAKSNRKFMNCSQCFVGEMFDNIVRGGRLAKITGLFSLAMLVFYLPRIVD